MSADTARDFNRAEDLVGAVPRSAGDASLVEVAHGLGAYSRFAPDAACRLRSHDNGRRAIIVDLHEGDGWFDAAGSEAVIEVRRGAATIVATGLASVAVKGERDGRTIVVAVDGSVTLLPAGGERTVLTGQAAMLDGSGRLIQVVEVSPEQVASEPWIARNRSLEPIAPPPLSEPEREALAEPEPEIVLDAEPEPEREALAEPEPEIVLDAEPDPEPEPTMVVRAIPEPAAVPGLLGRDDDDDDDDLWVPVDDDDERSGGRRLARAAVVALLLLAAVALLLPRGGGSADDTDPDTDTEAEVSSADVTTTTAAGPEVTAGPAGQEGQEQAPGDQPAAPPAPPSGDAAADPTAGDQGGVEVPRGDLPARTQLVSCRRGGGQVTFTGRVTNIGDVDHRYRLHVVYTDAAGAAVERTTLDLALAPGETESWTAISTAGERLQGGSCDLDRVELLTE